MTRQMLLRLHSDELVVDNFAGGGGASLGIEMALGRSPDIAVNHDPKAVAMHAENHPGTRHLCESVWDVDPEEVTDGRRVGLAWFSPDCTHFSKAKGGKPKSKNIRGLAWVVIRWAKAVKPRVIILENVEEFRTWGPLNEDGQPCKQQRGDTFKRWVGELEACGYTVEVRELRACDFGAPTTRKRLFVIARCDGEQIVWPEKTHTPAQYRTAAECIDWSVPCPSIFERKKPLVDNTMRRIARGIQRFAIDAKKPFIAPIKRRVSPTLIQTGDGERPGQVPRVPGLHKPLGTVVAGGIKHALISAFLAKHYGGHETPGVALKGPMHTVTAQDHHALVSAFLTKYYGTSTGQNLGDPRPQPKPFWRNREFLGRATRPPTESFSGCGRDIFERRNLNMRRQHEPTLTEALARQGFKHLHADAHFGRHHIINAALAIVVTLNAAEAWEWLRCGCPTDVTCDKCGDSSNSEAGLRCGRVDGDSAPCRGIYRSWRPL